MHFQYLFLVIDRSDIEMENFRWILLILVMMILIMQTKIWISEDGYFQLKALQNDVEIQKKENIFLEKRNSELEAEINNLKSGNDAIEERARNDLGLIGENETLYLIVDPN